uniref:Uncharacterized protein n=2 Tax=Clytia hemisphaerica TaxID=252671 RepID=A0A7M5WQX5_9CNID
SKLNYIMKEYKFNGSRNTRGERHGYGETILTNGDQYKGDYKNGLRHGKGEYLFTSSLTLDANVPVTKTVKYIGHYEENKKTGHGIFIYPNGSRYEGEWKDNKRHGNGTYYYSNGDVYSGDWVQDCRHGNGTYEYFTDQMKYIGMWRKGKRSEKFERQKVLLHGIPDEGTNVQILGIRFREG